MSKVLQYAIPVLLSVAAIAVITRIPAARRIVFP